MNILLVDDQAAILKCLHAVLTDCGHQVLSLCFEGEAAEVLALCARQKVDAALVGFMMPAMLGTELAAKIKRLSPATKIIIMIEAVPLAMLHSAFGALPAPFEREELFRQLSGVI